MLLSFCGGGHNLPKITVSILAQTIVMIWLRIYQDLKIVKGKDEVGVIDAIDFEGGFFVEDGSEFGVEAESAVVLGEDSNHHSVMTVMEGELGGCGDEGGSVALVVVVRVDVKAGKHVWVGPIGLDEGLLPCLALRREGGLWLD